MGTRLSIAGAGLAAFFLAGPAAANDEAPGVAHSTSFSALAPDTVIAVRPLDNTYANLELKGHFAAALARRAIRVQEMPAPVVLNFETEVDQTIRRDELPDRGALRYVLTATLDDEKSGRRMWQGKASYVGAPADEAAMMATMASVLADQVGRTVRERSFEIE